ncbi:helix-turn-helix transcriptional regulator [Streptococcus caviae]|uniref:hypothetical protein n=1 Tax=Streptococcus sp. 'caviae' TaxID=1915004 RepID=UPI00094BA575|nr:hypothetical protein [Streptococcus sp. 'caviae']OLN84575.1 hypothetical protein BMI76_00400 [Streptococcus sp. 'caviae']
MDNIFESLKDWIISAVLEATNKIVRMREAELEATLLKRKEVADMLNIDVTTFDDHYRGLGGFPKELPARRWSKLAIIKWLEEQK